MAALEAAIQVQKSRAQFVSWMAGSSPAMTPYALRHHRGMRLGAYPRSFQIVTMPDKARALFRHGRRSAGAAIQIQKLASWLCPVAGP